MSLINIEKTVTLDVYDHDTTPSVVKTIQLDTGTRTIFAMIQNSRQDYDIGQNATVSLTVLRPDKTKVQITGQTFISYTGADGTIYGAKAELSDVALAVKGNLKAQFKITSGEQELRTEIFTINNGEALDAGDGDWAGDLDGHNLDEMAQDIEDTKAAVSEMETDVSELKSGLNDYIYEAYNYKIPYLIKNVYVSMSATQRTLSYSSGNATTARRSTCLISTAVYGDAFRIKMEFSEERNMWITLSCIMQDGYVQTIRLVDDVPMKLYDDIVVMPGGTVGVVISYSSYNESDIEVYAKKNELVSGDYFDLSVGDVHSGYYDDNGNIAQDTEKYQSQYTEFINIGDNWSNTYKVVIDYGTTNDGARFYAAYKMEDGVVNVANELRNVKTAQNSYVLYLTIPADAKAIAFNWRTLKKAGFNVTISVKSTTKLEEIPFNIASGFIDASCNYAVPEVEGAFEKITSVINPANYRYTVIYSEEHESAHPLRVLMGVRKKDGTYSRTELFNASATEFKKTVSFDDDVVMALFSYRSYGDDTVKLYSVTRTSASRQALDDKSTILDEFRHSNLIDHTFINASTDGNAIIPSESAANIDSSKRLGFKVIEANCKTLSDGNILVLHGGTSGKFGNQVEHTDGVTDISDTVVNSVSAEWVKQNVRNKSVYAKYRTAPLLLQDFLHLCKYSGLIPLVQCVGDSAIVAKNIVGENNFIAYNATRIQTDSPITQFLRLQTKDEILSHCLAMGRPYVYSMANPSAFTDSELSEIISTLHSRGFMISVAASYLSEAEFQRCLQLGVDFGSSDSHVPWFDYGNLADLSADNDYSDFTHTGSVADGILTLSTGQTLAPNEQIPVCFLGKAEISITFTGSIDITIGKVQNTYDSNGEEANIKASSYFVDSAPTFSAVAKKPTSITNIVFKSSKV